MKLSRLAFISLSMMVGAGLLANLSIADEKSARHKKDSSWDFDLSSLFEGLGDEMNETFNGPKKTAPAFKWSGKVAAGKVFEVRGINGRISATPSSGSEVELVATRTGRRNDPESVKIEVVPHAGGVTVCAVYPSRDEDNPNVCKPGGGGRMRVHNNDVNVEFEIRVPHDVALEARNVNGGVHAEVKGPAAVSTVNGSIEVVAASLTEATTVNGSIRATVTTDAASSEDIKLSTVNGSVRLRLPEGLDADVSAKTVNGGIQSDFAEIEILRKWGPRSAEGRLGRGGRDLAITTVNGGVRISRGSDNDEE